MSLDVLAVASEAFPLVKTGGLADVVGALPRALAPHGVAVTTMLPGYPSVLASLTGAAPALALPDLFGGPASLLRGRAGGLEVVVLDAPHLFGRAGNPYLDSNGQDWGDNGLRFAAFCAAAAHVARGALGTAFDAVHAHDWQAGLASAYLRFGGAPVPCLFTIHNLAFQGKFDASLFPRLGLPPEAFTAAGLEYYGSVGFLKSGIWFSERITTVSPTYAAEIVTPEGGMGLDGLLRGRGAALSGILNGLDTTEWDPAADPHLAQRFSAAAPASRAPNKEALQAELGLAADPQAPLFAFVGRLAWQKGIDLVLESIPSILGSGGQLAILGSGERHLEERCRGAAGANLGRIATVIGFSEKLARRFYAGADAMLLPSRFEPCGLGQLCALRYGAPPLVARTGGLADTVIDANDAAVAAGVGTGFQSTPGSVDSLSASIRRAASLHRDAPSWARLQANAMSAEVGWERSAARYASLLRALALGEA